VSSAGAALAAMAAILAASAPGPSGMPAGDVRLQADTVSCDATTGACRLEGRVLLTRGQVVLRADRARYTPATGEVDAEGQVLLVDQARVVSARALRAVLGGDYEAQDVVAWLKDGPVRMEDVEARGGAQVGRNRLRLGGDRLTGSGEGPYRLEGARVTVCDCPEGGAPTWELRARRAEVTPGEHADLSWPVLWVTPRLLFVDRPVPVLPFPWLRLPLSDRQTGLLMPTFAASGAAGTTVALPVFVTLGRSADATLTAMYAFGAGGAGAVARGPGASLEVRWAPAAGATGFAEVSWLQDLEDETDADTVGVSGPRIGIRLEHDQVFSPTTALRVDAALYDDPLYVRDFNPDRLGRDAFYRRSAALLSFRGTDAEADVFAAYHLALAPAESTIGYAAAAALVDEYGFFGGSLPVFHRWPSATATLLPRPLGPLLASGRIGITRFAPLAGFTSDGGADGLGPGDRGWTPEGPGAELDGSWSAGERLAVTRADARAEISAPLRLGRYATLEPWVRGAVLGYLYDAALDPGANAWGVAGATVSTEISRPYGTLRHVLGARAEWRMGSGLLGPAPEVASYDQWDRLAVEPMVVTGGPGDPYLPPRRVLRAAPAGVFQQLRAALETRLVSPTGDQLRAAIGQDLDLQSGLAAETWFSAFLGIRPFLLDVRGRLDLIEKREAPAPSWASQEIPSWLDAFSSLRLRAGLEDARGDSVTLGLIALGPGASGDLVAGVDALFDPQAAPVAAVSQGTFAARAVLGPATLAYEAQFPGRPLQVAVCPGDGGVTREIGAFHVQQNVFRFAWDSPCRCFRARIGFTVDDCGRIGWSASLDLSHAVPGAR
jgi:LPS-assembly protein